MTLASLWDDFSEGVSFPTPQEKRRARMVFYAGMCSILSRRDSIEANAEAWKKEAKAHALAAMLAELVGIFSSEKGTEP